MPSLEDIQQETLREEWLWKYGLDTLVLLFRKNQRNIPCETGGGLLSSLITDWFEQYEPRLQMPTLLRGNDLSLMSYRLRGPKIGEYLERLKRAQFAGTLSRPTEAISLVRQWIDKEFPETNS